MKNKLVQARGRILCLILILTSIMFLNNNNSSITNVQAVSGSFIEDFTTTTYMDGAQTNVSGWGTGSIENARKKPTIVGSISSSLIGLSYDIFVDGNYAFVTDELTGLRVVDISNPTNPSILGSYDTSGIAYCVQVAGDYAFIADYSGDPYLHKNFLVLDITDTSNPTQLGNCSTYLGVNYLAFSLDVDGNLVFVANMAGGLYIIDVTDPTNPIIVGSRNTPGMTYDVVVEGNYAFLADGTNGMVVVNITNPTSPQIVTTFQTNIGSAYKIIIDGDYAYLLDTENGLIVIDISNPTKPVLAGEFSDNEFSDASIYGDFLYITDINEGLKVLNITDPTNPVLLGSITLPGYAQAIAIEGCHTYITCQSGGLQVLKITDHLSPVVVSSLEDLSADNIEVIGNYAYIASGDDGFIVVNVTDPKSPEIVGSYDIAEHDNLRSFSISGDLAYCVYGYYGLYILNISDPCSPTYAGSYDPGLDSYSIEISGNYLYLGRRTLEIEPCMLIFDITNPTLPVLIGNYTRNDEQRIADIHVFGQYIFLSNQHGNIYILDNSDPSSPTLLNEIGDIYATRFVIEGNYMYIACDAIPNVVIFDISDLANPIRIGEYSTFDSGNDIVVSCDRAYVAAGVRGFLILDISDPATPTLILRYSISQSPQTVFLSGDYVYTLNLRIFQVRNNRYKQYESICSAQSETIFSGSNANFIYSSNFTVSDFTPSGTTIDYYLSADNGVHWEHVTPGTLHTFSHFGNQLKWKAILNTSDFSLTPRIYNISINYQVMLIAPYLDSPIDSFITDDYTPTFTWSGIDGETNYLFQLDTSTSFTSPILNLTLSSLDTSYTPTTKLDPNTYYWRVAGIDSGGDIGVFSAYRIIYIIDDTDTPFIDNIADFSYPFNQTGNSITWSPTDSNPVWYNITIDGLLEAEGIWSGESITIDVDGLDVGVHIVDCHVYDVEGQSNADTVIITVIPTIPELGRLYYSMLFIVPVIIVILSKKKKQLF